VIACAGSSQRWGGTGKKEYALLDGRPVLVHALAPLLEADPGMHLVFAVPAGHLQRVAELLRPHVPAESWRLWRLVEGGPTRQKSVHLALEELCDLHPQVVLIHDGARPWASVGLVRRVLEAARQRGACIPVLEPNEAPKLVGPSGLILAALPRHVVQLAQTPQGFLFQRILEAHRRADGSTRTYLDDAEVYAACWGPVATVPGEPANRKITYPQDLAGDTAGGAA